MPDAILNGWEPDPRQVGKNWTDMFRDPQRDSQPPGQSAQPPAPHDEVPNGDCGPLDLTEYKPWIIQRVRTRPALMLELRCYDPRSSFWRSWAMPYHNLYAVESVGDRMLSLDFGVRQFVIEGRGLDELARHVQLGTALGIIEYAAALWPNQPAGSWISSIRRVGLSDIQ